MRKLMHALVRAIGQANLCIQLVSTVYLAWILGLDSLVPRLLPVQEEPGYEAIAWILGSHNIGYTYSWGHT